MTGGTGSPDFHSSHKQSPPEAKAQTASGSSEFEFSEALGKGYRPLEEVKQEINERTAVLMRSLAKPRLSIRWESFLRDQVAILSQERVSPAAWNTFLAVLTAVHSPSFEFISNLRAGIVILAGQQARKHARDDGPERAVPTAAEWEVAAKTMTALEAEKVWGAPELLKEFPGLIVGLQRLGVPAEFMTAMGYATYRALEAGQPSWSIFRELTYFVAGIPALFPHEQRRAAQLIQERSDVRPSSRSALFDIFDIFLIRNERLHRFGYDAQLLHAQLSKQKQEAHQLRGRLPSESVIEPLSRVIDEVSETLIRQGTNPVPALGDVLSLLPNSDASRVSLAPLARLILPHYIEKRWPLPGLLANFTPAGDEPALLKFQEFVFKSVLERGRGVEPFLARDFLKLGLDSDAGPVVHAYMRAFTEHPIADLQVIRSGPAMKAMTPPLLLAAKLSAALGRSSDDTIRLLQDTIELYEYTFRSLGSAGVVNGPGKLLGSTVEQMLELDAPAYAFDQIVLLVRSGKAVEADDLSRMLQEAASHYALFRKVQGGSERTEAAARAVLREVYSFDSVPFKIGDDPPHTSDPRAIEMHREIQRFIWRQMLVSKGFSLFTFEARRIPGHEHCALIEFGQDLARNCGYLNSSTIERFPGNGIVIDGLRLDRGLRKDEKHHDPYHLYRRSWPFARHIEDLEETRFIFTRGVLIVTPPHSARYCLPGVDASGKPTQEHYSSLYYNDHFHNPWSVVSAGVPTRILDKMLEGFFVPADEYRGFQPELPDLSNPDHIDLSFPMLSTMCAKAGTNALNFAWPSNLGGLANAYPARSDPYFAWETGSFSHGIRDKAGHVHKTFILGTYSGMLTPAHEAALKDIRSAHTLVYHHGTMVRDLLDGLLTLQSLWHKGETLARPESFGSLLTDPEPETWWESEESAQEERGKADRIEQETQEELKTEGAKIGPFSARRLVELYRWHRLAEQGAPLDRIPELRAGKILSMWPEQSPLVIDAATLTLRTSHYEIQFPLDGDGRGEEELRLWQEYVMPYCTPATDLRFWSRRSG